MPDVSDNSIIRNININMQDACDNSPTTVVRQKKYKEVRAKLLEMLKQKKQTDINLITIEKSIYKFEGSYLEETHSGGNLIRGFDCYYKNSQDQNNKIEINEEDRLFSKSSATYEKAIKLEDKNLDSAKNSYNININSRLSTYNNINNRRKKRRSNRLTTSFNYYYSNSNGNDNNNSPEVKKLRSSPRNI